MMHGHLPCSDVHVHDTLFCPALPCQALPGLLLHRHRPTTWVGYSLRLAHTVQDRTSARTREAGMGKLLQQTVQQ